MPGMHVHDGPIEALTEEIVGYAVERISLDVPPLDGPRSPADLRALAGATVTPAGRRWPGR